MNHYKQEKHIFDLVQRCLDHLQGTPEHDELMSALSDMSLDDYNELSEYMTDKTDNMVSNRVVMSNGATLELTRRTALFAVFQYFYVKQAIAKDKGTEPLFWAEDYQPTTIH